MIVAATAGLDVSTLPGRTTEASDPTPSNDHDRDPIAVPAAADQRVVKVAVLVVMAEAGRGDVAQPNVEVALRLASTAATLATKTGRTDAVGKATFDVPGGHGLAAQAVCSLGGTADFALTADSPTTVTLRLQVRAIVQGRVVDTAGTGIRDAEIVFLPWFDPTANPPRLWRLGDSDADGSFRVALAVGGRIGALHPGHASSPMYLVRAEGATPATPAITTVVLTMLAQPRHLLGRVVDAHGRPVDGAELEFRMAGRPPAAADLAAVPQRVRTEADGSFEVRNLAVGEVEFAARKAGHGPTRDTITVVAEGNVPLEVQLPPACRLRGRVTTISGDPVSGAEVTAGRAGAFDSATIRTLADGSYLLVDLAPGPTQVRAHAPHLGSDQRSAEGTVDLLPDQPAVWNVVLGKASGARFLRGTVVDLDGRPLTDWRVQVRGGGLVAQVLTGANGTFAAPAPGDGRCDVRLFAPGRTQAGFADEVRRNIDPADRTLRLVVDPRLRQGVVRGQVMTGQHLAVPASIDCWHEERAEWVRFQAGADGSFVLRQVPAGKLTLTIKHPGHSPVVRSDLELAANQELDVGLITLEAAGSLFGQITDANGQPPAACELFLLNDDDPVRGEYSGGGYRFEAAPPGDYTLHVQGAGLAAATFRVHIAASTELQQDIKLLAGVERTFRIVCPPEAGDLVSLAVRVPGSNVQWISSTRVGRGDGRTAAATFSASMAPGTYEAVAWGRSGWNARTVVAFQQGADAEVELELAPR